MLNPGRLPLHELTLDGLPSMEMADDEIHVWSARLDPPQGIMRFLPLLSPDEMERAGRFYFENDRQHYVAGRGLLRILLGNYLLIEPAQVQFDYHEHGKPALKWMSPLKKLQFNVSHSNDLAVYIFSWKRLVGIDVEQIRSILDEEHFAEQLFSPNEAAFLHSLSGEERVRAFFKIWTCKEAFFKALGDGLTAPIDQIEISLDGTDGARLVSIKDDARQAANWNLEMFTPEPDYQASFATEGQDGKVVIHHLEYS